MFWSKPATVVTQYRWKSNVRYCVQSWHAWIEGREVETLVTGKSEGEAIIKLLTDTHLLEINLVRK